MKVKCAYCGESFTRINRERLCPECVQEYAEVKKFAA
jgi:predicted amidophosphoribosyltransferase